MTDPTDRRIAERRRAERRIDFIESGHFAEKHCGVNRRIADRRRPHSDRRKAPHPYDPKHPFAHTTPPKPENETTRFPRSAAPTPVQPAGAPIRLNSAQSRLVELWAKDDRLWTTQETVAFNLEVFARATLAAASVPVQPVTEQEAREFLSEWGVQNRKLNYYTPDKCDLPLEARPSVVDMMTAFANRTAPASEGK